MTELDSLRETVIAHTATMTSNITVVPRDCVALWNIIKKGDRVLEFAGGQGQTTAVLLHKGVELTTCEMDSNALAVLRPLVEGRAALLEGPIGLSMDQLPEVVDVLVIDADHSKACAEWYIEHLWPRVREGGYVWLHDMRYDSFLRGECACVMEHIEGSGLEIVEHNLGRSDGVDGWESIPHQHGGSMACSLVLRR